jgi:hypothetical protein
MADEVPIVERRKVVIEYQVDGPTWEKAPAGDLNIEQAVLEVLRRLGLDRTPL